MEEVKPDDWLVPPTLNDTQSRAMYLAARADGLTHLVSILARDLTFAPA
jgi:hypothetical protein